MSRRDKVDYTGARERISLRAAAELGSAWLLQPKFDGQYVDVHTDRNGRVFTVTSRTGREIETDLIGVNAGSPWAQFCGELTGHTDRGRELAAAQGYQSVHVFDCVQLDGRRLDALPFRERWELCCRAWGQSMVDQGADKPWQDDALGRAHSRSNGRYTARVPSGWRRLPRAETRFPGHAAALWQTWVDGGLWAEGLVAVAADAPVGARRAKLKIKRRDTLDAVVVSMDRAAARLVWGGQTFVVSAQGKWQRLLRVGALVSVAYEGFYVRGNAPKFPRLTAVRDDL